MLETDGRVVEGGRDPPGQSSSYIPPGDQFREMYRLTTFAKFPDFVPVHPCALAKHGFFYTGYKDRVKCFRCGRTVENWSIGDDPSWNRWHASDCALVTGRDTDNVPIESYRSPERQRRHRRNSREAASSSSNQTERSNLPRSPTPTNLEEDTRDPGNQRNQGETDATSLFPCLEPVNPHMRERASRLSTFRDSRRSWPSHRINATPEQMVDAGLYYLGERDRVKCWYCNGGLQNWDRFDDPWFEHAKWFPSCEYLLQKKGPEYVHNVVSQYPNINRPTPVNASRSLNLPQVRSYESFSPGRGPTIVDPREEIRRLEGRVEEEMRSSPFMGEAKMMGFSEEEIRFAMMRRFEEHNSPYESFADLVDFIVTNKDQMPRRVASSAATAPQRNETSDEEVGDGQSLATELERLKHQRSCKVCKREPATAVLLPCGHLAACGECSKDLRQCPLCQATVREVLNSYIV